MLLFGIMIGVDEAWMLLSDGMQYVQGDDMVAKAAKTARIAGNSASDYHYRSCSSGAA